MPLNPPNSLRLLAAAIRRRAEKQRQCTASPYMLAPASPSPSTKQTEEALQTALSKSLNRMASAVRAHMPRSVQAALWNIEYRLGRWSYLDNFNSHALVPVIERYHTAGSMLDLGCGTAHNFTPPPSFTYLGVDISSEAIRQAEALQRPHASYLVADITEFQPTQTYDVILMREVLNYLPLSVVPQTLNRMNAALSPNGIMIILIWNIEIFQAMYNAILQSPLGVLEKRIREDGKCTLIMAPSKAPARQ